MSILYDPSAVQVLERLGFDKAVDPPWIAQLQTEKGLTLPKIYLDFIRRAAGCPLLSTSDLGREQGLFAARLFSDFLRQQPDPDPLPAKFRDYLVIGADYDTGCYFMGIPLEALAEEDPPVYWAMELGVKTRWKKLCPSLSVFLNTQLFSALSNLDYETGMEELEPLGWQYEQAEEDSDNDWSLSRKTARQLGLAVSKLKKYKTLTGSRVFCCMEETEPLLFTGYLEEDWEPVLYALYPEGHEPVFSGPKREEDEEEDEED